MQQEYIPLFVVFVRKRNWTHQKSNQVTHLSECPEEIPCSLSNCKGMKKLFKLFDLKLVLNCCVGTTKKLCSNTELSKRCYLWHWRLGTQSDTKLAFFVFVVDLFTARWSQSSSKNFLKVGFFGLLVCSWPRGWDRKVKRYIYKLLNEWVYLNHWLRNYDNAPHLTTRVILPIINDHFPSKIMNLFSKSLSPVIRLTHC